MFRMPLAPGGARLFSTKAVNRAGHNRVRQWWLTGWSVAALVGFGVAARAATDFLPVSGSRLFYEVAGAGPDIVFLHDGQLHSESWDAQWEFFSQGHRLIRYDRRGFGKSTEASAPYSDVDDLYALCAHLGVTNAVLVACSAGGRLALDFTLEHPALVQRLVLVGPVVSGLPFSEHFNRRVHEGFQPLRERNDVGATITNWMNDPWLIASTNHAARKRFRELLIAHPQNLTKAGRYARPPAKPALGQLGEIHSPTLIVVGESDIPDVHAHCGAVQAGILNAQRVVVPGAGHLVHLERPAEFNQLVARFLAGSGKPNDHGLR